jgi:hypothetical protein
MFIAVQTDNSAPVIFVYWFLIGRVVVVHHIYFPEQRWRRVWAVSDETRRDGDGDDEDAATEQWMRSVGHDVQLSTIELLTDYGMAIPPANESK